MEDPSPWTNVFTLGIGAAIALLGAYSNHRFGLTREKKLREAELDRHARYLAIRVV